VINIYVNHISYAREESLIKFTFDKIRNRRVAPKNVPYNINWYVFWRTKESGEANNVFFQLISEKKASSEEVEIYTNGLKSIVEEDDDLVGCAIFVLQFNMSYSYKLNPWTSSFMAEAYALDKAIDLIRTYS